jgi:hypothetical protein
MKTCNCERCGRLCQVAETTNAEAKPIRKSLVPKGCCVDCSVTCFIKTGPLREVLPGGAWTAPGFDVGTVFRLPHVQQQFAAVLRAGKCVEAVDEIDWGRVIAKWDLPAPSGWDWKGDAYCYASTGARRSKR